MSEPRVTVIGTAPHGFAGAGTIHAQVFAQLARAGYEVALVSWEPPYRHPELVEAGVAVEIPEIVSDAFPRSDALRTLSVIREIMAQARSAAARGRRVVLVGTYLFPFFQAIEKATALLSAEGVRAISVAVPAGSDIWQIGLQVPELARDLLRSRHTHRRVSYTQRFADEIATWFGECGEFEIIPPPIDIRVFHPASEDEKRAIRLRLGIPEAAVVLLNCSNMRPVKGIDHTVRIAREFAAASPREVVLLLVGPVTPNLLRCLGLPADREIQPPEVVMTGRLTVHLQGLQRHTRDCHAAADVAINTSYHDSFNVSLAESLACGTPVVSSDVVGIRETMNDARVGHFFAYAGDTAAWLPGSPRVLTDSEANKIIRALVEMTQKETHQHLGDEARRAVIRTLAPGRVLERWEALIRSAPDLQIHGPPRHSDSQKATTVAALWPTQPQS